MVIAVDTLVKQLTDSGIISLGTLSSFVPPLASSSDAKAFILELSKQKLLTPFQARKVSAGKTNELVLGNYVILDMIGAGGMGQVFKASHRRMERVVAIKTLPSALINDEAASARFRREVVAAAKLSHTNIVTAYDADEAGGTHFLVMEYVEGIDLSALVKRYGPVRFNKAISFMLQAARGLEFAHSEGVVHRDIKPANLLLDKKGVVKVLDMGLARIESSGEADKQAELTGTGAVMGTIDYMAPEQALCTKTVDGRADIYSLGCSLYYLLTGKPLYGGTTVIEKLLAHREQPIPELHVPDAEIPKPLEIVFRKMVAKQVADRFQNMREVIIALERCQKSLGISNESPRKNVISVSGSEATLHHDPLPKRPTDLAKSNSPPSSGLRALTRPPIFFGLIATGFFGLAVLYGVIVSIKTKDGTLEVSVDQPDSIVQVLDAEGKVEITQNGGSGKISISVDPGKHRLRVEKDGFAVFGQEFEIDAGGTKPIAAKLVPVQVQPMATPVVESKPKVFVEVPAFKQWRQEVASQPAELKLQSIAKKLQELNQGFDGKLTGGFIDDPPKIENGVVTELGFATTQVTDISPVRALPGLRKLNLDGGWSTSGGILTDLSPLQGMQISQLWFNFTQVNDISPLAGMPLTELSCFSSRIESLEPLKGMPLTVLAIGGTNVADLAPLKGMPLRLINFGGTLVSDLSPLKGMPLTELGCAAPRVSDVTPLEGMGLNILRLKPEKIYKGMDVLRRLKSLTMIESIFHGVHEELTPAEFWKRYDAGQLK